MASRHRPCPFDRRPRRAAILLVLYVAAAVGCGDATTDPVLPPALTLAGPATMEGKLERPAAEPAARRFECTYDVRLTALRGAVPLGGATLTVQPWKGGDLPVSTVHRFAADEVATWVGRSTIATSHSVTLWLGTWHTFVPTTETFGDTGAHRATWAFAYGTSGDSARYQVECTAATERVAVMLADARRGLAIPALPVTFDGQPLVTSFIGLIALPPLVAGRYRLEVRDPAYVPLDTLIETGGHQVVNVSLTRLRPEVESAEAALHAGAPAGGSVDVYHPLGSAALPRTLPVELHDSTVTPARVRAVLTTGQDLDAERRRYTFAEQTWGTSHIVVRLPLTGGETAVASCRRYTGGAWLCRDRWPAPGAP